MASPGDAGCSATCESLGFECGEVCGRPCGSTPGPQLECVEGRWRCLPACSEASCEQPDGCGSTCGLCPAAESCSDCVLRLSAIQTGPDGRRGGEVGTSAREVPLAVDFAPGPGHPLPAIADLRVRISGPARLVRVGLGTPITEAGKRLVVDPETGRPYQVLPGGVHQLLLLSTDSARPIPGGRWLFLDIRIEPATEPAVIELVKREETFAPPAADEVLWGADLGRPVVIWPQEPDGLATPGREP
ncbi:MAG: hypothetical protein FJ125_09970 [Deltaproteobacteria bacterium]|nr:hypothetical protein [Deltaproteobacteria bacterium]